MDPASDKIDDDAFEILEMAGAGGMGTVYRAKERSTGRIVALKMLQARISESTRFTLEANVLAKLKHPAIVEYIAHGLTSDRRPYLAMEWLEGESLEDRVMRGTLSVSEALRVTRAICDALVVAHDAGIIHRDLKPSNVFLTTDASVKLLDFGIAKTDDVKGLTGTGQTLGTPGYMSPEQARAGTIDTRSDLFSLGCVMFRMLGGQQPFRGSDLMVFATQLALAEAPPLEETCPEAPPSLAALVKQLLAKQPEDRPADAKAVRDAVDRIVTDMEMGSAKTEIDTSGGARAISGTPKTKPSPGAAGAGAGSPRPKGKHDTPIIEEVQASPPPGAGGHGTRTSIVAAAAAVAVIVGVGLGLARGRHDAATSVAPSASSSASTSASASASAKEPESSALLRDADRAALGKACREWSGHISRGQHADGSFAGNQHADTTGWDTAQQTFALTEAHRACSSVGPAPIAAGVKALDKLRVPGGWIGMRRAGAPNVSDRRPETPAIAWALLATNAAQRIAGDASIAAAKDQARADLAKARASDGGFRYIASSTNGATLYSTMLGAWALVETEDPKAGLSQDAKRSLAWLRKEAGTRSENVRSVGVTEQLAWTLARAERRESDPANAATLRALAADVIEHCHLENNACTRPLADTGRIPFDDGEAKLVTLWHPWSALAAFELAREPALPLDADTRRSLASIARWGNAELTGAMASLAMAPEYKIGEYLITVSRMLDP